MRVIHYFRVAQIRATTPKAVKAQQHVYGTSSHKQIKLTPSWFFYMPSSAQDVSCFKIIIKSDILYFSARRSWHTRWIDILTWRNIDQS